MTEPNYIDIAAMQRAIDEREAKQSEEFKAGIKAMKTRELAEQKAAGDLFAKTIL